MGCDGGSIPKRCELVKTKSKESSRDTKHIKLAMWRHCALSKDPLKMPLVSCRLGRLYNKESVLRYLLSPQVFGEGRILCGHIKSLKDVVELQVTPNPTYQEPGSTKARQEQDGGTSPFVCPVTGKEMNGHFRFLYLRGCGCVLSEQAMKEIRTGSCLKCGKGRIPDDIVFINCEVGEQASSKNPQSCDHPERKRTLMELPPLDDHLNLSLSGMATFRKTPAVASLYKRSR